MRLDQYLTKELQTRTRAQDAIKEGRVLVDGKVITKSSFDVKEGMEDKVEVLPAQNDFVSRAGGKLEGAVSAFSIDLKDQVVLDIGASTGGFTQCCLNHGASKVYALDVGHLQLSPVLDQDCRVVKMEGTNAKTITKDMFAEPIDFVCMDVSFISSRSVLEPLFEQFLPRHLVLLFKPQFEVGKQALRKGIVKDPKTGLQAAKGLEQWLLQYYSEVKMIPSPVVGRKGNQEYLLYAAKEREK